MEISKALSGMLMYLMLIQIMKIEVDAVGLAVVIVSQNTGHHASLAEELQTDVQAQANLQSIERPAVYVTHRDFPDVKGAWTYLPLIKRLSGPLVLNSSWLFFCEDYTKIYLQHLYNLLGQYDSTQEVWIGYGLQDKEPTIIHHFSDSLSFKYPHLGVGFAMSSTLINSLASRLDRTGFPDDDFSIDPSYELARFVLDSGRGATLTHSPLLCIKQETHCASRYLPFKPCSMPVPNESIHFAVKTCKIFHTDRVLVVQNTWGPTAHNIAYYSDFKDAAIPTVDLGVPNTVRGHCGKTLAIIQHVAPQHRLQWLVIADDDTLISVARLQAFLSCYSSSETLAVGERYGYNVNYRRGYSYITGGGGIVLSMPAVRVLAKDCHCPSNSTPDDMYLGLCMVRLNISVIHSPLFHQARPADYAPDLLSVLRPISFHKYWMMDPLITYKEWLFEPEETTAHIEL